VNGRLTLLILCLALLGGGCANQKQQSSTTRPSGPGGDPADRATRDPSGYSPDWSETNIGGDTEKLDRNGLRRDLGNVFMP
jgi:hypothetical protein